MTIRITNAFWYSEFGGSRIIGIVRASHDEKEPQWFIGTGAGEHEASDAEHIAKHGAKFDPSMFNIEDELAGQLIKVTNQRDQLAYALASFLEWWNEWKTSSTPGNMEDPDVETFEQIITLVVQQRLEEEERKRKKK
jgi:hypothetical protein